MSDSVGPVNVSPPSGWRELWRKEDWWAIWIGLSVVAVGCLLFWSGGSLRWLAVVPPQWSNFSQVIDNLAANWLRYGVLYLFWLASFSLALTALGQSVRAFAPAFTLLFVAAYAISVIGKWRNLSTTILSRRWRPFLSG